MYRPTDKDKHNWADYEVCLLTPFANYQTYARFTKCVANMVAYSWMHGLKVYQWGTTERMVVDWARNDLARNAFERLNEYTGRHFTHFLWLDDDHLFNPDLACFLAANGHLDMVSALYYGRTEHLPVVYIKDHHEDQYKHYPLIEVPEALVPVDAVGFGSLLMKRDVFARVPEPWFTIDYRAGEDIAFCVHAKKHGVEIFCDGRYKIGHLGDPQVITEKTYKSYVDGNPKFTDKVKVKLYG